MKKVIFVREDVEDENTRRKFVYSIFDQDESMLEEIKNILKEIRER